jgi:hypothetical protein
MRQASGRAARAGKATSPPTPAGANAAHAAATTLAERLRAIGPEHPRRRRAMMRILVETLLAGEFGEPVANDASFQAMVDDVLDVMQRSTGLASDLDQVLGTLLGSSE